MSEPTVHPALVQAARYIPVYTRPAKPEASPIPKVQYGCFDCKHGKMNMGFNYYQSVWLQIAEFNQTAGTITPHNIFSAVICANDSYYHNLGKYPDWFKAWRNKPGPYWPLRGDSYVTYQGVTQGPDIRTRMYRIGDGPVVHNNGTVSMKELLQAYPKSMPPQDFFLWYQPLWQEGIYADLVDGSKLGKFLPEHLRFYNKVVADGFLSKQSNYSPLKLTRVAAPGSRTKRAKNPNVWLTPNQTTFTAVNLEDM